MARDNLLRRIGSRIEEATGYSLVDTEHLRVTEAVSREAMILANDLEEIGYVSLNYLGGRPNEPGAVSRRRWAQEARVVWLADPMAGAAVEMLNEFTFGRGVARPRFKDAEAQEIIDEAWDDPQNQRVLTSFLAQLRMGNSLSVQDNVFLQMFDEGEDGKVKLSFLNHDNVVNVVSDEEVRQRVLFYVATKWKQEWDYKTHTPKPTTATPKTYYYEAWASVEEALRERGMSDEDAKALLEKYRAASLGEQASDPDESGDPIRADEPFSVPGLPNDEKFLLPPPNMLGEGKIYHLTSGNLDMEMTFGVPRMRRTIRWYTAYNDFMKARVDMMAAAASFIMTKTVQGSGPVLEKLATKAMRAASDLRSGVEQDLAGTGVKAGPLPGSILGASGGVKFEPLNLNSGAGNAQTDGQMLRAQVSAGDRFPQHYLGDIGSANLATATSMELPVLKHVEARQELIESVFRWFIDRVIERAVEANKLDPNQATKSDDGAVLLRTDQTDAEDAAAQEGAEVGVYPMLWRINKKTVCRDTQVIARPDGTVEYMLLEAHEDKSDDEAETGRDLSYEFGMPSPLRRMMTDLVAAAVQTATMADPNGLNVELTRVLLTVILSEGFEMQDAADVVARIFPKGYDPMAALQAAQGGAPGGPTTAAGPNFFGPGATDQPANPAAPYGTPNRATAPEQQPSAQEGYWLRENGEYTFVLMENDDHPPLVTIGRHGMPVLLPGKVRGGVREGTTPLHSNGRVLGAGREFERDVRGVTMDALAALDMNRISGNNGKG